MIIVKTLQKAYNNNYMRVKTSTIYSKASAQRGFTLIELIVVISIIGILASVLVANFMQVREKTRDGVRKSDLEQIRLALETYRIDVGSYPVALYSDTGCDVSLVNPNSGTVYMEELPCDPREDGMQYVYLVNESTYLQYDLYACAENINDSEAIEVPDGVEQCAEDDDWHNLVFKVTNP